MNHDIVFRGPRYQKGYGLGGFFAKLMRGAIPMLKSGGKYLVKKVAKTGMRALKEKAEGIEPRSALKRRLVDTSDEMMDDIKRKIRNKMVGRGRIHKPAITMKKKKKKKKTIALKKKKALVKKKINKKKEVRFLL